MSDTVWSVTDLEKAAIRSLVKKGQAERFKNDAFNIIDFDSFFALLTSEEVAIANKYLSIDPKQIAYKLPYLGYGDIPRDLIAVCGQMFIRDNREHLITPQYLPKKVFDMYTKLNGAMERDTGKKALIEYGYRSPACQVNLFFKFFEYYDFNFEITIARVCFAAYSEHVCHQKQAIDFITIDGIDDDFDTTEQYQWLKENAAQHGFYESYPKGNEVGMMYEPWHWAI